MDYRDTESHTGIRQKFVKSTSTLDTMVEKRTNQQETVTGNINISKASTLVLRFPVYHRLSLLVIVPNLVVIVYGCVKGELLSQPSICLNAVASNVAVAVLIRQDHVINALFWTFGQLPHRAPLLLRRHAAKLYHLGGIHSGTGVAAGVWYLCFNIAATNKRPRYAPGDVQMSATIFLCVLMDVLLLQILMFSIPTFRSRFHNVWEQTHRFAGWLLLVSFWAFLVMYNVFQSQAPASPPLGQLFYLNPAFYLLVMTTISISLPWLGLRKVVPRVDWLSSHAVRLHFDYADVGACKTPRFSTGPLVEWHSFASIPNSYTRGFSVIVSRAGDWTSNIIDNPPTTLWTRGRPARGVLYMAKMFRTILCVGTGSGIAPILGLLTIPNTKFRILWSAQEPERTFGPDILRRVLGADPKAVVWDTKTLGRPDLVEQAWRIYNTEDIEAVFVISNAKVTTDVVFRLEARGVAAFGPIFDS